MKALDALLGSSDHVPKSMKTGKHGSNKIRVLSTMTHTFPSIPSKELGGRLLRGRKELLCMSYFTDTALSTISF
jgi:hypothetical protein